MENEIINILGELIRINSVNPTLSDGPGEEEIAEFVAKQLMQLGVEPEIHTIENKRKNVVASIPGIDHGSPLILNGHLDTVGIEEMDDPFNLRRDGDRLYGRGTYDMKGSLAVMLLLAEYITQHKPPMDILLTFTADEEAKSMGMDYLVKKWLPRIHTLPVAGIVLEPTELQIGISHKGFSWYEINVVGKGAHGSRPEEGTDAILPLRSALEELNNIQSDLLRRERHPLLGHASLHAGVIEGGTALSVIPSKARLQWERRTLPGESQGKLNLELERVIQAVRDVPGNHKVSGREIFVRPPYEISYQAGIVKSLQEVSPQSKLIGLSFWADSAICGSSGIPSVLFGPVGHGAHAADEWVSLKSLVRVYETLKKLIMTFETS